MNQTELAQIRIMIGEAVDSAVKRVVTDVVQPLRDDIDILMREAKQLEAESRKHSGEHKDLAKDVESTSQNDLKQDATIAQILMKVSAVEQDVSLVKVAQEKAKNERAVTAAMTQDMHTQSTKFMQRHPTVAPAVVGLIVAIANAVTLYLNARGH